LGVRADHHTHPRAGHLRPGLRVVSARIEEFFHSPEPLHELIHTQTERLLSRSAHPTHSNLPVTKDPERHRLVRRETRRTHSTHLFTYGFVVHPVHEEGHRVVHEPVMVVRQPLVVRFRDGFQIDRVVTQKTFVIPSEYHVI
jgi:hypothetical protein